jgi:hypothetical protein
MGNKFMKKITAALGTLTVVVLTATPLQAAQIRNSITGSLGIAENACVLPISLFVGQNCNFSGGPLLAFDFGLPVIGPLDSGGFYASAAAAPGFTLSTQTGVDDTGTPLTSFLVGVPASPDDGKAAVALTGQLVIDDGGDGFGDLTDTIAGTVTIGPGARVVSAGSSLAGSKTVVEQWTSVTHTLAPTAVNSAAANGSGGFDYVLGSAGFPPLLCTGDGAGNQVDCFASEMGSSSGAPPATSPWNLSGSTGFNFDGVTGIDITRYGLAFPPMIQNPGGATTAVINGLMCMDTGLDPKEPGDPADTVTDCSDSSVAWGVTDPIGTDMGKLNAGIDNLVLMLSTDAGGNIVAANAYYTMEYPIIQPDDNSFVGGTLSFTGTLSPPCVAGDDPFSVIDDATPQTLDVLANDSCDDPPLTVVDNTVDDFLPDKGGAASTDGATVTYTPAGGGAANDPEVFTYTVEDSVVPNQDQGTVTITLFDDLAPVANNQAANTDVDTPVVIDTSAGGNSLGNTETGVTNSPGTGAVVTQTAPNPTLGMVSIVGANVTYTPNAGETGSDTFGYTITDSNNDVANAEITVTINATPVAPDFTVAGKVDPGGNVAIDVAADIPGASLGDPVATITATDGALGTTSVAGTVVTYTHAGATCGADSFDYTITDGDLPTGESDTGTISLTVNCLPVANDAVAPDIDTVGVSPDSQSSGLDVAAIAGNDLGDQPTVVSATDGANGTVSVTGDVATYTPNADFFAGTDTFDYDLTDDDGDVATGTITVTLPDVSPTAGDLSADTDEGVAVDVDVIGSITPGNGSPAQHAFTVSSNPGSGTAQVNGTVVTYTPNAGFSGTDSFEYSVTDGDGSSASATITVTVTAAQADIPVQDKLPGGSNALGSELAALLLLLPWLRRRRGS